MEHGQAVTTIGADTPMARMIAQHDWDSTPLGPIEGWSESPADHAGDHAAQQQPDVPVVG